MQSNALLGAMMICARKAAPFFLVLGFVFGIAQGAHSQGLFDRLWGRGQSYEDCILQNMRGVTSDLAAREVRRACQQKDNDRQPPTPPRNIVDVSSAIKDIGGESYWNTRTSMGIRVYHNTPNMVIDHIFINFGPPGNRREFRCQRTSYFTGEPGQTSEYYCGILTQDVITNNATWSFSKVMGYRR